MVVGQVGFHKDKEVRKIRVSKRENHIVNRLNKTKREIKNPDLRTERENRQEVLRKECHTSCNQNIMHEKRKGWGALFVEMDFTRTFLATLLI